MHQVTWSHWVSNLCTIQVFAQGGENYVMVYCTVSFMERSLLSQTHFINSLKTLEAFDIRVSSSTSSLLLAAVELRYLNLFTWVSTWPFICIFRLIPWASGGDWYITTVFLRLIFNPNAFADFEKWVTISCAFWWLCVIKRVLSASIFLIFLADLNWLALNRFIPGLLCIHTLGWNQ